MRVHLDHFPQGAADTAWIPEVGKRGWILLTIDDRLRYNPLEQRALMESRVAAFVLAGGRTHDEKAEAFLMARRRITAILASEKPPFIAKIHTGGRATVWLSAKDWRKARAR